MACGKSMTYFLHAVWHSIALFSKPAADKKFVSALHELHCLLPLGNRAVHCNSSNAHTP